MDAILCRYGELALKGKNRHMFESRLVHNIKDCLKKNNITADLKKVRGRIFIFTDDKEALPALQRVFGLVSISPAVVSASLPKAIEKKAIDYVSNIKDIDTTSTFRITTRRIDKEFPKTSQDIDIMLGDRVGEKFNLKAKMKGADLDVGVEIHDQTFIFHEKLPCFGGLPIGVGGKVAVLIEDDCPDRFLAAAWLMMKRGCIVFPIGKKEIDIDYLSRFSYGSSMKLQLIKGLIEINSFAEENGCQALIVGDTAETFDPETYKDIRLMTLTPLIAYDEKSLSDLLVSIR